MNRDELQSRDIQRIRDSIKGGSRAPLFVAPCGYGKSNIATRITHSAFQNNRSVVILNPRRELVHQVQENMTRLGIPFGTIMSGERPSLLPSVQIASVPSLHRRGIVDRRIDMPRADCVIIDEAHEGTFGQCKDVIDHYRKRGAVTVGLTATPARPSDGRGLGEVYDDLILGPSIGDLIGMGYLVQPVHFRGDGPDLDGVAVNNDYVESQVSQRVRDPILVGAVVSNWFRLASDRKTLVFAANRAHARHLCDEFAGHGVAAEYVDANTETDERRRIHDRFAGDKTQLLVNVGIYTYGVDIPPISCIVMATPTKSIVKFLQCTGRGLRASPGKSNCYILDHGHCTKDCGFVDDEQPWSLDGKTRIQQERSKQKVTEAKEIECRQCNAIFRAATQCPNCGSDMKSENRRAIAELEADLLELDRKTRAAMPKSYTIMDKQHWWSGLLQIAGSRGKPRSMALALYKAKFGVWPRGLVDTPLPPMPEVLSWEHSQRIRWSKGRSR